MSPTGLSQRQDRAWSALPPKAEVSYSTATQQGTNTMAETVPIDSPSIGKLHRAPDGSGFLLDQSRVAYLRSMRRERQHSRSEADADYVKVKTKMPQPRLMEKRRELVRRADVDALIDGIAGVVLTHLSSLPARCAPRGDLATRRSIEWVVFRCAPRSPTSASRWPTSTVSRRFVSRADETKASG
jgi:hypothetical protein